MKKNKNNKNKKVQIIVISIVFGFIGVVGLLSVNAAPSTTSSRNRGGGDKNTSSYVLKVTDSIWNGYANATVVGDVTSILNPYILASCYKPTQNDQVVFVAYYPLINYQAQIGPLSADGRNSNGGVPLWMSPEPAECTAELGYVSRDGFGKWIKLASTTFRVSAQ